MGYLLKCHKCGVIFDYDPPDNLYLDVEQGRQSNKAPARCPNNHVRMYDLSQAEKSK
jgi:hypothetical protein